MSCRSRMRVSVHRFVVPANASREWSDRQRASRGDADSLARVSFIEVLLVSPSLSVLAHDVTHHEHLAAIIRRVPDIRGNLLHDTHTVALMREHGLRVIYTRDADFHRFPEIEVRDPLR